MPYPPIIPGELTGGRPCPHNRVLHLLKENREAYFRAVVPEVFRRVLPAVPFDHGVRGGAPRGAKGFRTLGISNAPGPALDCDSRWVELISAFPDWAWRVHSLGCRGPGCHHDCRLLHGAFAESALAAPQGRRRNPSPLVRHVRHNRSPGKPQVGTGADDLQAGITVKRGSQDIILSGATPWRSNL